MRMTHDGSSASDASLRAASDASLALTIVARDAFRVERRKRRSFLLLNELLPSVDEELCLDVEPPAAGDGGLTRWAQETLTESLAGEGAAVPENFSLELLEVLVDLEAVGPEGSSVPRVCLLYTSPSPRDGLLSRMPSSA